MTSPFIADLIDHKQRVAKHIHVACDLLYGHVTPISIEPELKGTLFEIVMLSTGYQQYGAAPFTEIQPKGQVIDVCSNTMAYFSNKEAYDGGWMWHAISDLFYRAAVHDNSKFGPEEFDLYNAAFPEFQKHAMGSPGIQAVYASIKPALDHHLKANDHHVEYFKNGVADMHSIQQIEMCCDWLAASARSKTGIERGLEINKEKYRIDDHLFPVLKNTIKALKEAHG